MLASDSTLGNFFLGPEFFAREISGMD